MRKIGIFFVLVFLSLVHVKTLNSPQDIESACYSYLQKNLCEGKKWGIDYHFYRPSATKYSKSQWMWDSGSHQIVWSNRNVTNSMLDLETMFKMQQKDGFIPEIIFWGNKGIKDKVVNQLYYANNKFATISQTPVITFSLERIYSANKDKVWLKKMVYPMYRYLEWWVKTRDPTKSGLVSIIHGWESGIDASPAYDEAYFNDKIQPQHMDLYPKFVELLISYHLKFNWNVTEIVNRKSGQKNLLDDYFFVQDTMVNSILAAGYRILSRLALEIGDTKLSSKCKARQIRIETAIINLMWIPELNRFASARYRNTKGEYVPAKAECAQSLFPLLLETLPKYMKDSIVKSQLTNTSKFWTHFPVPGVSLSDPSFQPSFGIQGDLLWRGPTWPIINYFIVEGLVFHNETLVANQLLDKWIQLYVHSGVWEHYNPLNGLPYGEEGLGMSTLIVDSMYKHGILKKSA